ncbi:MAG: hypothetical protein GY796_21445 [Chloroflexi bacterium]|nr:hypothetical protein [Chloroflexota bacterium]
MIEFEEIQQDTPIEEFVDLEKSFVVADIGNTNTTVILVDTVAGSYRLLSRASVPTTIALPWLDVTLGVQQAVRRISEVTGRTLLNERGELITPPRKDGSGVDHFTAVVSAPVPLKVVIIGLYDEMSIASARKALHTIFVTESDLISLADTRSEDEQISAIIRQEPDLIFIVGGTDGGAEEKLSQLIEAAGIAAHALAENKRPHVLYAGNINLREQVRSLMSEKAHIHMADNVRPDLQTEQIDDAIGIINDLYENIKIRDIPGIPELNDWASFPLSSAARSFSDVAQYFAALQEQKVLGVDLGSNHVSILLAEAERAQLSIHTDLGMGQPVVNLLQKVALADIARWIPTEIDGEEVADYIYNKSIHPQTIPMVESDLYLEQAVAREILCCALQVTAVEWDWSQIGRQVRLPQFSLLLARGSVLANAPRPGQVMLLLLDALQPTGIFAVALDQYGVLPPLGALAPHEPLPVVQALEAGVLSDLGWVIAPTGRGQTGKKALDVVVESEQGRFEGEAEFGKLEVIPIAPGKEAKVTINPSGRLDIGFGPGQKHTMTILGGRVGGLIIDARGRPLTLPQDDDDRRSLVRKWHWDLGG